MPRKKKTQAAAEVAALIEGTLPDHERREDDRRAPEPITEAVVVDGAVVDVEPVVAVEMVAEEPAVLPKVEIPNDQIHVIRQRADGVAVNVAGCIIERDPPRIVPRPSGKGFE